MDSFIPKIRVYLVSSSGVKIPPWSQKTLDTVPDMNVIFSPEACEI